MSKVSVKEAKTLPGAHLMDFSGIAVFADGVAYFPSTGCDHPGRLNRPFSYKPGQDGPQVDNTELLIGASSSMMQRKSISVGLVKFSR